jgi:hypothetical protein
MLPGFRYSRRTRRIDPHLAKRDRGADVYRAEGAWSRIFYRIRAGEDYRAYPAAGSAIASRTPSTDSGVSLTAISLI